MYSGIWLKIAKSNQEKFGFNENTFSVLDLRLITYNHYITMYYNTHKLFTSRNRKCLKILKMKVKHTMLQYTGAFVCNRQPWRKDLQILKELVENGDKPWSALNFVLVNTRIRNLKVVFKNVKLINKHLDFVLLEM